MLSIGNTKHRMKITGLNKLDKLIKRLDNIKDFVLKQSDSVIDKNKKDFIDQNKLQLNAAGIGSDGQLLEYIGQRKSPTGDVYTKGYETYKNKRGGQTGHIDLRLTGVFQRSLLLFHDNPGVWSFRSEDDKLEWLTAWYGENILGVTEEFLDQFSEDKLQPELQTKVDKYLA